MIPVYWQSVIAMALGGRRQAKWTSFHRLVQKKNKKSLSNQAIISKTIASCVCVCKIHMATFSTAFIQSTSQMENLFLKSELNLDSHEVLKYVIYSS